MKRLVYIALVLTSSSAYADDDLDVSAAPAPPPPVVVEPPPVAVETPPPPIRPPATEGVAATARAESLFDGLVIGGYVQAQGQVDQQSQDQLAQGGAELNKDNFVVRRARLAVSRAWTYSALALEIDANTVRGATVGLRRAEAILIAPAAKGEQPYASLAIGLTDIPFGFELAQPSRERLFTERTTASLALFPGEPDVGARAWGAYDIFRWTVAVEAGEPVNERAGLNRPDPNQAKDLLGRVGIDTKAGECVTIAGGVSFLVGRGFHPGTDATKDSIEWHDLNEDGAIQLGELSSVPGQAALPSENFDRWALGADVELGVHWVPGWLHVQAEVVVASNLDRGLFVADPVVNGIDTRELGAYVSAVQDVRSLYVGARVDYYDPNLDAFDSRGGMLLPTDETLLTVSPLFGVRLPHRVRASLQYDYVIDHLARDSRGVPSDLANDRLTARLQVEL